MVGLINLSLFFVLASTSCSSPEIPGPNCDPANRKSPVSPCSASFVWRPLNSLLTSPEALKAQTQSCPAEFHTAFKYNSASGPFTSGYTCGTGCKGGNISGDGFICDESIDAYRPIDSDHLYCYEPSWWIYMSLNCDRLYQAEKQNYKNFDKCLYPNCPNYNVALYNCHDYQNKVMDGNSDTIGYYRICNNAQNYCNPGYTCCLNGAVGVNHCYPGAQITCCGVGACSESHPVCCSDGLHCCTAAYPICDIPNQRCLAAPGSTNSSSIKKTDTATDIWNISEPIGYF